MLLLLYLENRYSIATLGLYLLEQKSDNKYIKIIRIFMSTVHIVKNISSMYSQSTLQL